MAKIIGFDTPQGTVNIAVREPDDAIAAVGIVDDVVVKVRGSFEDALSVVAAVGQATREAIAKAPNPPEVVDVQFGLQFSAKGTAYVVEMQGTASITVKLSYKFA